jgi:hypothetical protein
MAKGILHAVIPGPPASWQRATVHADVAKRDCVGYNGAARRASTHRRAGGSK